MTTAKYMSIIIVIKQAIAMAKLLCFGLLFYIIVLASGSDDSAGTSEQSAWQQMLNDGGLHIGAGRAKRFVELAVNQPNVPHQSCLLPDGKQGHCRHLHHCMMDVFKNDILKFMDYLCIIQRSSIGTCCPDSFVEERAGGLAGDLPATAPREEENEAITRITKAENRGCGVSTRAHGRVVGARPANPREWPWMAFITPEGFEQYCGGVLITDRHVLTAAHCTRRWQPSELFVRLGEYDVKRSNDSRSYNFRVVEIRQHKEFQISNYHNDIAILKLHRPAVFNSYVWPICLPPLGLNLVNQSTVIIGWGHQWYGGPFSPVLMEVTVPVWEHQRCVDSFTDTIFDNVLCAGSYTGGKDSCQGDSGGPLMYQMPSGRWTVVGVVSWGIRCGEPNHPGVYTKVDEFLPWILENAQF